MRIAVYSKAGCGKCERAKEKLHLMGYDYEEHMLAFHITFHKGWEEDGSIDLLSWVCMQPGGPENQLPTIQIDNKYFNYSAAMSELKQHKNR